MKSPLVKDGVENKTENAVSDYNYDVRGFGAVGDGVTLNTAAIQKAIDSCAGAGGGRVVVPPGVFVSGTIYLKSRVTLSLAPGATLLGSPDMADYNSDDAFSQNRAFTQERVTAAHLVVAVEQSDIGIEGPGTIDGNSKAFLGAPGPGGWKFTIPGKRPGQMICFVECQRVRVTGARLENAPYWTLFLHGCETVMISGARIDNPFETPNGDGIDVDSCRNVVISDCIIRSGDDSITLRANPVALKNPGMTCENVAVTNCILSTPCNAVRVGVGDGAVRHCVFSNIVISDTRNGICLIGNYSGIAGNKGSDIEDIRFSNMTMRTLMPFFVCTGIPSSARFRNILFSDIRATGGKASVVRGVPENRISNIKLRNVELEISGGHDAICADADLHKTWREWEKGRPCALHCACADDVLFDNVSVRWGECDGPWRHALLAESVGNLAMRECDFRAPPDVPESEAIKQNQSLKGV